MQAGRELCVKLEQSKAGTQDEEEEAGGNIVLPVLNFYNIGICALPEGP